MIGAKTDNQILIAVSAADLGIPVDTLRREIENQLPPLATTLEQHSSVHSVTTETQEGPIYTHIAGFCPDCESTVQCSRIRLQATNSAIATATCTGCGWQGFGEYRLIDLSDSSRGSAVANGLVDPAYYTY